MPGISDSATAAISGDRSARLVQVLDEAAETALEYFNTRAQRLVELKSPRDYVSDADRAVEQKIRRALADFFPGESVVGEELGGAATDSFWIVDPIDGTSNYLAGLPFWAISIAFMRDGVPELGGICVPALGYLAVAGPGHTSVHRGLVPTKASAMPTVVGVGRNGYWQEADRRDWERAAEQEGHNIVGFGSCALSLLLVSLGRLGAYYEQSVALWDCAAGVALCRTAGIKAEVSPADEGRVTVWAGRRLRKS